MAESSPSERELQAQARWLLQQMLGTGADFRAGQWEAIRAIVLHRQKVLVVQRTGWGKSLVYFLATKLLRDRHAGPTLLISPLLSLIRNQIEMARKIGIYSASINSDNRDEWKQVEAQLVANQVDVLLISPERLNNEGFVGEVLPRIQGRIGLFVVDEAHCISDWGHDFRPDYRRIARVLQALPRGVPVLGTTATANDRVVADVLSQMGKDVHIQRGPLARASLCLQNIQLRDQSERLAWLAEWLPRLPGRGVVYCLTVADTERVAAWLRARDINVNAYSADSAPEDRIVLERDLVENRVKGLIATVALGMGFDKPDLGFVVHYQRPGSVVAYYQQVGRAGRAIENALGVLLSGREDDEIQNYFIESAFPPVHVMQRVVEELESSGGLTLRALAARVNIRQKVLEQALKLLQIDGAVARERGTYYRTPNAWHPDVTRIELVTEQRRTELAQMQEYVTHQGCLMEFLARALDDPTAAPCGRCANCTGRGLPASVQPGLIAEAERFLKRSHLRLEPRRQWPAGAFPDLSVNIPAAERCEVGCALCVYGDAGWGHEVKRGKYLDGRFSDKLVEAAAEAVREWNPTPPPAWVTAIPSLRHPELVPDFATRLAKRLGLPFRPVLSKIREMPPQKEMQNSAFQARNVMSALKVTMPCSDQALLLVDDVVDSRWTMTVAGWLLRQNGSGPVFPFALATAAGRDS